MAQDAGVDINLCCCHYKNQSKQEVHRGASGFTDNVSYHIKVEILFLSGSVVLQETELHVFHLTIK